KNAASSTLLKCIEFDSQGKCIRSTKEIPDIVRMKMEKGPGIQEEKAKRAQTPFFSKHKGLKKEAKTVRELYEKNDSDFSKIQDEPKWIETNFEPKEDDFVRF